MRDYLAITKALADETRVRALLSLTEGELCVCQIIQLLGLSPSTVSKHMAILQQAGLVERHKDGRWAFYRLPGRAASPAVRQAIRWTRDALKDDPQITRDARTLRALRKKDPQELTVCYNAN